MTRRPKYGRTNFLAVALTIAPLGRRQVLTGPVRTAGIDDGDDDQQEQQANGLYCKYLYPAGPPGYAAACSRFLRQPQRVNPGGL
jgi:hypothetical protein